MNPPSFMTECLKGVGRLGGVGADMLGDRLELAALELRQEEIRLVQVLFLVCLGTALCLVGLVLLLLAVVFALPAEWRLYGLAAMAFVSLLGGLGAYWSLRRRLSGQNPAFAQSVAELRKDKACF